MPKSNKNSVYGVKNLTPTVSSERFHELVSLYLDKEASQEELELLSSLLRVDDEARKVFAKSCSIHLATCRMFGKNCVLDKLPGFYMPRRKRISRRRAAFEWTAVAVLMTLTFVFFLEAKTSFRENSEFPPSADLASAGIEGVSDVSISDTYISNGKSSSIFELKSEK